MFDPKFIHINGSGFFKSSPFLPVSIFVNQKNNPALLSNIGVSAVAKSAFTLFILPLEA